MNKISQPKWFKDGKVLIINAPTCGINKDGNTQFQVDEKTGERSETDIDDKLKDSVCIFMEKQTIDIECKYVSYLEEKVVIDSKVLVPQYHDKEIRQQIENAFSGNTNFELIPLGELIEQKKIKCFKGHGSPSSDQRVGDIPYIKVSDIRAGQININPTNKIPLELAKKFWKGDESGLKAYDLISPERASKNIGEFSVLMPNQERIVLTKEVIVLRSLVQEMEFDQFYLMWAMSLELVRKQWNRVILMQTNREDVGERYKEILIPIAKKKEIANSVSGYFRKYYLEQAELRRAFQSNLDMDEFKHSFYLE